MCAYENRLRITALACFRDVNKNLGWGLPPFWLTDFSIDLYLLANEIKVVKMITETKNAFDRFIGRFNITKQKE